MAGAQNKKDSPGAFKSCLIPYQEQIFIWWYDERLSATEIQKRLLTEFGIEVHRTTLARFIKIRHNKPDPHQRPPHLQNLNITQPSATSSTACPKTEKTNIPTSVVRKTILPPPMPPIDPETATGEELIQYLESATPQELGRLADAAKEKGCQAKRK